MKRTYKEAELEVIKFHVSDVIETSGQIVDPDAGNSAGDNEFDASNIPGLN